MCPGVAIETKPTAFTYTDIQLGAAVVVDPNGATPSS